MIRTVAMSLLLSGAPLCFALRVPPSNLQLGAIGLALIMPAAIYLLVRHTRQRVERRTQQHTLDMLARGNTTLDLILSEIERRAPPGSRKAT
jgi:hypothetical protein